MRRRFPGLPSNRMQPFVPLQPAALDNLVESLVNAASPSSKGRRIVMGGDLFEQVILLAGENRELVHSLIQSRKR